MRVTNRSTARNYLKNMNKALTDQANISRRLETNNRFEQISEDVSAGVQAMKSRSEMYKVNKQLSSVQSINEDLSASESAMTNIGDLLAQIHPKIQKAITGSSSDADRKILADEIKTMKEEILADLNAQSNGQYMFGGTNNYVKPFTLDPDTGNLKYNGIDVDEIKRKDDGTFYYKDKNGIDTEIPMNEDVYMDIGLGIRMSGPNVDPQSGYKVSYNGVEISGYGLDENGNSNNIINVLNQIGKALTTDGFADNGGPDLVGDLDKHLVDLTDKFRTNITDIGARTQFLGTMENRLTDNMNNMTQKMSRLTATDFGEESIHQSTNNAVVNAIYRLGANVIPMSLMDFIK